MSRLPRTGRTAAAALLVAAVLVALAPPAVAHPLGAPQQLRLHTDGDRVVVEWQAPTDDLTALALHLGLLAETRTYVYEGGALVPAQSDAGDAEVLASSEALRTYLLDRLTVAQNGRVCPGRVTDTSRLSNEGARLTFACPDEIEDVRIEVRTLTDVHPAYRTMASSASGERATYSSNDTTHRWALGTSSGERAAPLVLPLAALLVIGLAAVLSRRVRHLVSAGRGKA